VLGGLFSGPYWVVAVGPSNDTRLGYDWAIVSGGPPSISAPGGCRNGDGRSPGSAALNRNGFWLFSRKPVDPAATAEMRARAAQLGFDLSVLLDVQQQGCKYEGAE
jgi:hypothetical protein